MRKYLPVILWILLSVTVLGQDNLGARPMGMGGAFVGLADDENAIFTNPAGVAALLKDSAFMSARVAPGREQTTVGGVQITPLGNLGFAYVQLSDDAPVKATTQTLHLSFAKDLNREINVPRTMGTLLLGMDVKF